MPPRTRDRTGAPRGSAAPGFGGSRPQARFAAAILGSSLREGLQMGKLVREEKLLLGCAGTRRLELLWELQASSGDQPRPVHPPAAWTSASNKVSWAPPASSASQGLRPRCL